jgi:hypothetical protein
VNSIRAQVKRRGENSERRLIALLESVNTPSPVSCRVSGYFGDGATAEGVETSERLPFLKREACDEVQGYAVGRAAPIETSAEQVGRVPAPKLEVVAG